MFGHQDNRHDDKQYSHDEGLGQPVSQSVIPDQNGSAQPGSPSQDNGAPAGPSIQDNGNPASDGLSGGPATVATVPEGWQHPGEPLEDSPGHISDIVAPSGGHKAGPMPPFRHDDGDDGNDDAKLPHELIDIKQKALGKLSPLIDQLDQSPEERFRTLMMMIQASDDQNLIRQAYEIAEKIEDEKMRAQALLDVVNEINYFTQHPKPEN